MLAPLALAVFLGMVGLLALIVILRLLRKGLVEEYQIGSGRSGRNPELDITLVTYQSVIQQFKAQGQELERLRQQERQRARAAESMGDSIISNLSSGILLFSPMGLVQQANPAAKRILGYASPYSLHARDIFRGVSAVRPEIGGTLPEILERVAKTREAVQWLELDYATPPGERRILGVSISPVLDGAGAFLGAACLISDLTATQA